MEPTRKRYLDLVVKRLAVLIELGAVGIGWSWIGYSHGGVSKCKQSSITRYNKYSEHGSGKNVPDRRLRQTGNVGIIKNETIMWLDKMLARCDLNLTMNKAGNTMGKLCASLVNKTQKWTYWYNQMKAGGSY